MSAGAAPPLDEPSETSSDAGAMRCGPAKPFEQVFFGVRPTPPPTFHDTSRVLHHTIHGTGRFRVNMTLPGMDNPPVWSGLPRGHGAMPSTFHVTSRECQHIPYHGWSGSSIRSQRHPPHTPPLPGSLDHPRGESNHGQRAKLS